MCVHCMIPSVDRFSLPSFSYVVDMPVIQARTLVFSIAGLDVGFENPMFACLEYDYEEADDDITSDPSAIQQSLTFYELDLGLHMIAHD